MRLHVLTRCSRPERLDMVRESIFAKETPVHVEWHIIFDTTLVRSIDTRMLQTYTQSNFELYFWEGVPGDMAHSLLNKVIDKLGEEEWFCVLDDDNEMHPDFLESISNARAENPDKRGFIYSQYVGGKDFTGLEIREAKPENTVLRGIDMAQITVRKDVLGKKRLIPMTYVADGILIEEVYRENPHEFHFIDKVLCNYNSLQSPPSKPHTLPRVIVLDKKPDLKSFKAFDFESDDLNVMEASNQDLREKISSFNPDAIITSFDDSVERYPMLSSLPYDFRQRWINIDTDLPNSGEMAYTCAMHYMLSADTRDLVSVFTPIYNTKEKLHRTYQSILSQTHTNWEWVIVNDSTDNVTLEIAENIAKFDPRVRVYDFKEKSKGIIGEAKYRACALSRGNYLLELDHDDVLLPHALEKTVEAFNKFPDAGFVYTDCAEIDEQYNSLTYGDGFSFGYGSYREEAHGGITFKVANTANINPLTIRHIVGVPNHIRCWRRDVYFKVGGHNRRLSIADDYELVVRTFLETRMVKVPICCYLQFYHGGNSQDATRSDIQRRVRTISIHYGERIRERFEELGMEDWAYNPNGLSWGAEPRKGEQENYVNYIL